MRDGHDGHDMDEVTMLSEVLMLKAAADLLSGLNHVEQSDHELSEW